jgi:hypothetical protein
MGRKGRWYSDGLVGVEAALLEDKGLGRGARGDRRDGDGWRPIEEYE